MAVLGRALLWGLLGALAGPLAMIGPLVLIYRFTAGCGSPGDSGGCAMGTFAILIASVPAGAALFFAVALARGVWVSARARVPARAGSAGRG